MKQRIESALSGIAPYVRRTPCRRSGVLSDLVGGEVYLKLENHQTTGSFKLRGVANKVRSLGRNERGRLLVAASTGNHGMAFAHIVDLFGLRGRLFIPATASKIKVDLLRRSGIPFDLVGDNCVEAEEYAREYARKGGHVWVSPYNDIEVIRGQGTVAVELAGQLERIEAVLVPVGGGGLISGMAAYLKAVDPGIQVDVECEHLTATCLGWKLGLHGVEREVGYRALCGCEGVEHVRVEPDHRHRDAHVHQCRNALAFETSELTDGIGRHLAGEGHCRAAVVGADLGQVQLRGDRVHVVVAQRM